MADSYTMWQDGLVLPPGKRSIARFIFVYTPLTFYILSVVYVMERLSAAKPPSKNDDAEDMMTRMAGWRRQQQQQQQQQNSCNNKKVPPTIIPLSKLTKIESSRSSFSCTKDGLVWIENRETTRPTATTINTNNTSGIPKLIHQTSRTRCLTVDFAQLTRRWKEWGEKDGWSYYFHDDEAMQRLYHHASSSSDEFPNMMLPIFQHCLLHGTARADLWRYLLLYIYGGIYADLDTVPDLLTTDMIAWSHQQQQQQHDALFVVEQYHLLSQYFMAVTPRHPLMWYALQHAVLNVAKATDTGQLAAAMMTGPHALHQAYQSFRADVGVFVEPAVPGRKPVSAGTFRGTNNRTVTVIGVAEDQNEYINRDALGNTKRRNYKKLGMTFHQDDRKHASGQSCLHALLEGFNGF